MIWILAAQLSLPLIAGHSDIREVFFADDYPAFLQRGEKSGVVRTRTTIEPEGSIQGCVAERSYGNLQLDAYTCDIIVKRAKFIPAKWMDGSPVYGVIRVPVIWLSRGPIPEEVLARVSPPDLEISVNHLPKGAKSIAAVSLAIAADENGRPVSCAEWVPPANAPGPDFPELVPIACQQAMASLTLTAPADATHKPVRSVQSVLVNFKVGP